MKDKFMQVLLMVVLSVMALPLFAQDAATEPRATKGGTVVLQFKNIPSEDVGTMLGDNFIIRAGYHCAPLAHKALGTDNGGAVRVSFGYYNTVKDVEKIPMRYIKLQRRSPLMQSKTDK